MDNTRDQLILFDDEDNSSLTSNDERNECEDSNYQRDLDLLRIKCYCSLNLFVGILFCMTLVSYRLGSFSKDDYENSFNKGTFDFILMMLNFMNIFNILLLIYNKYVNYRCRNLVYDIPIENNAVLYFLILPLTAGCIAYFLLAMIYNSHYEESYTELFTPIVEILFYASVLMLLIDFSGKTHTGEDDHLTTVTIWAQFITIIGVVNNCMFHFTSCILHRFIEVISQFYNITYFTLTPNNIIYEMENKLEYLTVVWGFVVIAYLIDPAKKSLMDIERMNEIYINGLNMPKDNSLQEENMKTKKRISTTSLVLSVFFITISFLNFPVNFSFNDINKDNTESNENNKNKENSLSFFVTLLPMLLVDIVSYIALLKTMSSWDKVEKHSTVDRILMYGGIFGGILKTILFFINSVDALQHPQELKIHNITRLIFAIINLVTTMLQFLVMDLSFIRKPKIQDFKGLLETFNPVVLLFSTNVARLIFGIFSSLFAPLLSAGKFSTSLLEKELYSISKVFMIVYCLYSVLYFGTMLRSIYY